MRWPQSAKSMFMWHRHFLLLPTKLDDSNEWAWLETVWRRYDLAYDAYYYVTNIR